MAEAGLKLVAAEEAKPPQSPPRPNCQPPAATATDGTPVPADHFVSEVMKRDWNARAAENARYYVRSTKRDQSEEEFDASGEQSVRDCVVRHLPLLAGNRDPKTLTILEIGCGVGRMTKYLARLFNHVHAIDVSGEIIRQARSRLGTLANVSLYETSGSDLALFADGMFDLVFSFIVFQHIPERAVIFNYIQEAHRVLQPGGILSFQVQGFTGKEWMETPKDTWHGVAITEQDVVGLCHELGFDLLAKSGQGTQYSFYTLRKHAAKNRVETPAGSAPSVPNQPDVQSPSLSPALVGQLNVPAVNPGEPPASGAPKVSILIPVLNQLAFTQKCLEAVKRNTPANGYEVIIWDNGSTDDTPAFFQQRQTAEAETIRYFRSEENLGFVGGNNAAAQRARGEFLVLLNNDTEPQPGWLEALLQTRLQPMSRSPRSGRN